MTVVIKNIKIIVTAVRFRNPFNKYSLVSLELSLDKNKKVSD